MGSFLFLTPSIFAGNVNEKKAQTFLSGLRGKGSKEPTLTALFICLIGQV
ncbi:hypothetical protein MTsN2n6_00170 [Vibrio fortis]